MKHDFHRRPDWRWRRAHVLIERGCNFSSCRDDDHTGRAVRFLRAMSCCRTEDQMAKVATPYPDLHAAYRLNQSIDATRIEVQARLLARQTDPEIAVHTGVPAFIINSYEVFFFQVRGHLDARDWVAMHAVRRWECDATGKPTPAAVLRSFAFYGGPVVLEAVLPYLIGGRDWSEPVYDLTTPESQREQGIRLAIALQMLPRIAGVDKKLLKMHTELIQSCRNRSKKRAIEHFWIEETVETLDKLASGTLSSPVNSLPDSLAETTSTVAEQIA